MTRSAVSEFLTAEEVAERLRVSAHWVNAQARTGRIPAKKIGRQWRFTEQGLADYLERADNRAADPVAMSPASRSRRRRS